MMNRKGNDKSMFSILNSLNKTTKVTFNRAEVGDIICHIPSGKIFRVYKVFTSDVMPSDPVDYYTYRGWFGIARGYYIELDCLKLQFQSPILD